MSGGSPASAGVDPVKNDTRLVAAPLVRRMAAFLYEGVLLFGVLAVAALVYGVAVHQTSGIEKRSGLIAVCFVVLGLYFIALWTRAGQTLAMKTWHLRVLTDRGLPLSPRRALARYLASWVWFVPPLALAGTVHLPNAWSIFGLVVAWIVLYALSALLNPSRQFWHDWLCDTAIVSERPAAPLPQ
ncbi:MAG: RDD family protein [Betaproteobacteria bacterium]